MTVMIDWVTADLPLSWDAPITGGFIAHTDPSGVVQWSTAKRSQLRGSHDKSITLRTVERGRVEFSGNPAKFLQGHNVFGPADLPGMVAATMVIALESLGHTVDPGDRDRWLAGDFSLSQIDITAMYELPRRSDVQAWLRSASESATCRFRGRGHYNDGTLYFGHAAGGRAKRWSLKLYCKAVELMVRGHELPQLLSDREKVSDWADNKLRIELTLRGGELDRHRNGRKASFWNEDMLAHVFSRYAGRLELGDAAMLASDIEDKLPPRLRLVFRNWKAGDDLRAVLPHMTFYRYRRQLLDASDGAVDIRVIHPKSNVVPLRRVLEAVPAAIPAWAGPPVLWRRSGSL